MRRAFTLMELLIVMMILAILVGMALVGLNAAINDARRSRTQTIINKIDGLLAEKWEGYRVRAVPIRVNPRARALSEPWADSNSSGHWTPNEAFTDLNADTFHDPGSAWLRLTGLRELQRIELPDRISDLCTNNELVDLMADSDLDAIENFNRCRITTVDYFDPTYPPLFTIGSVGMSYKRQAERSIEGAAGKAWTTEFQGAECLYLILSVMKDGDKSALDYFSTDEVGDTDGDGMREMLDGWGRPLEFIRWTPGYTKEAGVVTDQTASTASPDPFDPVKSDGSDTYAIRPLIYSAGLDGEYEINRGVVIYSWPDFPGAALLQPNDPYYAASPLIGSPADSNGDGVEGWADNITNHSK